jgi:quercetin dioxygenase-like cupin family protein
VIAPLFSLPPENHRYMVVNREVGASSLSIWIACHKAGEVVPLHTHEVEEVLTIIAGEAIVTVNNDSVAAHTI